MNLRFLRWLAPALLLFPLAGTAETLVLVQGWLGSGDNWRSSGVTSVLEESGWMDGGRLSLDADGVDVRGAAHPGIRRFYTLELPTTAPLRVQEIQLARYLSWIQEQYPEESIVLAGHSAGGVLARLYMVTHPEAPVSALISFASPHLGAESAQFGAEFGSEVLDWLEPYVGAGVMARLLGLFRDLAPPRPGNLLGWLNHQRHPPATYISVVRREDSDYGFGDLLVPAWSQDMNHVYALRGRARTVTVGGRHGLSRADGKLLVDLLFSMRMVNADGARGDCYHDARLTNRITDGLIGRPEIAHRGGKVKIRELLDEWQENAGEKRALREYRVKLPLHDAARLLALTEMYPGRDAEGLITDLLSAALDELEEALPYVQGSRVISRDEFNDPIYEDTGPSPRFAELTEQYTRRLDAELKNKSFPAGPQNGN